MIGTRRSLSGRFRFLLLLFVVTLSAECFAEPLIKLDGFPVAAKSIQVGEETLISLEGVVLHLREHRDTYEFSRREDSLWLDGRPVAWGRKAPAGAELAQAWAIWTDDASTLDALDPETALNLALRGKDGVRAKLPEGLRYLAIAGRRDNEELLVGLTDLRYLAFQGENLDASRLTSPGLVHLDLALKTLRHPERLADLDRLRELRLSVGDFRDVSSLLGCDSLESLSLDASPVEDLRPLAELKALRRVSAVLCPLNSLPEQVSWSHLDIQETPVSRDQLDALRASSPRCQVWHVSEDPLRTELTKATRLRVRSDGTCHVDLSQCQTLYETQDSAELDSFLAALEFQLNTFKGISEEPAPRYTALRRSDYSSLFGCMCCGGPSIEIYEGKRLLATFGNQHGERLRWADGPWVGDKSLTDSARENYLAWLEQRGIESPLQEFRFAQARDREDERKEARAARDFPPVLLERGRVAPSLEEKLKQQIEDPRERLRLHFQVAGASNGDFSAWQGSDSVPDPANYSSALLKEETFRWLESGEPQMARGAARFLYCSELYDGFSWSTEELSRALPYIIESQLNSFADVRLEALDKLDQSWPKLQPHERERILQLALEDPSSAVRARACRLAGAKGVQQASSHLQRISEGAPRIREMPFDLEFDKHQRVDSGLDEKTEALRALQRWR